MQDSPTRIPRQAIADVLMVMLCSLSSFWLLASPLIPYVFDYAQFLVAYVALTAALAFIGVKLNHLANRNARLTFGRGRRR
jgi:hypothetical protein